MAADRKDNYSHIRLFCRIYSKLLEGVYCSHLRVDNEQIEGIELSNGDHSSSQISKSVENWAAKRVALQAQIDRWVVLVPERLKVSFRGLVAGLDSRIWGSVFSIPDAYMTHMMPVKAIQCFENSKQTWMTWPKRARLLVSDSKQQFEGSSL